MKTLLFTGCQNAKICHFRWFWLAFMLLFWSSFSVVVRAQDILWDKTLGGNSTDELRSLQQTSDGGYILGGSSGSGISGDKSEAKSGYWVVKLKADRSKEWDKTIGGNSNDVLISLQQTSDGGYILGGYSRSGKSGDKSEANKGPDDTNDYWVVKLNANGTKAWDKTFGGNESDILTAIQQTGDGGYILGGYSFSGISGNKSQANKDNGFYDYWIVKLKADGGQEWDKTFGGNNFDNLASLQQTQDGGYILGGWSYSDISGDKTEASKGENDYWIVKLDATGKKLWDKTIGGSSWDDLRSIRQTGDGGYILGGSSTSGISGDKSEASWNEGEGNGGVELFSDYWIVKLRADGTKVWDKTLGYYDSDELTSLQQTRDGGYILGGYSRAGKGGDKSEAGKGWEDYWVVKLDATGTKVWDKTIGGDDPDRLTSLQQTSDGNYILGGYSYSNISGDKTEPNWDSKDAFPGGDYWVVKIKEKATVNTAWNRSFGGAGTDNFTVVIPTTDGGYLYGGFSNSGISGNKSQSSRGKNDYWIVKADAVGKKLWDKRYGGSEDDFLTTLIQTQVLGGSSLSGSSGDKSQPSRGDRDYWVVKTDAQGNKQWDKRFGGSGYDELKQVYQLPSGRYILAGTSTSPAGGDKSQGSQGGQDYWILKIYSTGAKQWDKRYGGSLHDALTDLAFTLDGGFLLGGSSVSGISGDKTQTSWGGNDYWLVRITGNGEKVWDKRFGGTGEDYLTALGSTGTSTGNFFLAGHSTSGVSGDKSQSSRGGKDYWLLKINGEGTKLWDKRYGGSQHESLRSIILTRDGGYLLGGSSTSGVSGDKSQPSWGSSDYWVVKTSSTGVLQWERRFGGSGSEELRTVWQTPDGGYILGGRSDSGISGNKTQPSQGGTDYWLVKVAPENSPIVAAREAIPGAVPVQEAKRNLLKAYPNPFRERVTVSFTLPQTQPANVKEYDNQGREITTLFQDEAKADQTYEVEWQANNKAAGMYFLQLQTPTTRQQQKLLLTN